VARLTKEQCEQLIERHHIDLFRSDGSLSDDGLMWVEFWAAFSVDGLMELPVLKNDFLLY